MDAKPASPIYPQLDALRGLAVLAVVVGHATNASAIGHVAVRVFFVLSGFLITDILLRARADTTDRWYTLRAFYARRALRIFPLAYAAIAVALVISPFVRQDAWLYLAYAGNHAIANRAPEWGPLGHFWSLAVEEQFYMVWPLLALWVPRRWLPVTIAALCVGAVAARGWFGVDSRDAYVLTVARMDSLLAGAALALLSRSTRWTLPVLATSAACLAVDATVWPLGLARESVWVTASAAVVQQTIAGWHGGVGRVMTLRPLQALGGIAYGVYVWHQLIPRTIDAVEAAFGVWLRFPDPGLLRVVVVLTLTIPVAAASFRWFEQPINAYKDRFPYRRRGRDQLIAAGRSVA